MRILESQPGVRDVAVFGAGLHITVDDEVSEATVRIRRLLEERRIQVRRLDPIQPSMEDVFVALIEAEERKAA